MIDLLKEEVEAVNSEDQGEDYLIVSGAELSQNLNEVAQ